MLFSPLLLFLFLGVNNTLGGTFRKAEIGKVLFPKMRKN